MTQPNERDIEKRLKASGARRLDQVGTPIMHSAQRETLQTEVRRQYRAAPRWRPWTFRWYIWLLPKVAVFVALGACAWLLFMREDNEARDLLAMHSTSAPTEQQVSSTEEKRPGSPVPIARFMDSKERNLATVSPTPARVSQAKNETSKQLNPVAVQMDFSQTAPRSVVGAEYFKADRQDMYMGIASTETHQASPLNSDTGVAVAAVTEVQAIGDNTLAKSKTPPLGTGGQTAVLQEFAVLNEGTLVQFIEADGSTYAGQLLPVEKATSESFQEGSASPASVRMAKDATSVGLAISDESQLLNFGVAVSGTNRSLGQAIQFIGNLTLTAEQVRQGRNLFHNTLTPKANQPALNQLPTGSPTRPGRVLGTAVLENGNAVAVDAVPTPP